MAELTCIIGWPVARSLSPAMHNAAFAALGLPWTYVPIAVRPGALADGMALLETLAVRGANVTVPHKQAVIGFLASLDDEAASIGAVNTIVRTGAGLVGHNTDGAGFLAALAEDGFEPAGARAHVIGAGGAARAVVVALARAGAEVSIAARRPGQAEAVAALHARARSAGWSEPVTADLVVQATSAREGIDVSRVRFAPDVLAVDLIYGPPTSAFLAAAEAAGARARDGLGMLLHQAALSFRLWTGREAPLEAMRAAAREALTAA